MKKLTLFLALISSAIIFIYSCHKDDVVTSDTGGGSSGNSLKTTVSGIVLDENNAPQNGVAVSIGTDATTTDQHGVFVLKNISVNQTRCIVKFSKAGFFNHSYAFIPFANTVNYTRVILISNAVTHGFSSSGTATLSLADGSSVVFSPNSFVTANGTAYTGIVTLTLKHLSPGDANFGFMIPGGDLAGKDLNNKDVSLYTYGMLGVELKGSNGEALQLASGNTATLTLPIATTQITTAPSTLPLWFFDETTSLWKEEGTANRVGNYYVGTVKHFSWWNCDLGVSSPVIKGKVIDCEGNSVPNIVVTVNGWATTLTNQNGEYQGQVPAGLQLTVQVLASNNGGVILNSQLENVPALSYYQTYIVPDLIVPCTSRILGTLKTCNGENTSGFVSLSANGLNMYQYTLNSSFDIPVIPNTQLDLNAYSQNKIYHQIVNSPSSPNILNIGNILMCDSIIINGNSFILNGGPFSNQTFNIITTYAVAKQDSAPLFISIAGSALPDFQIYNQSVSISDTIPGSYVWNWGAFSGLVISFNNSTDNFYLYSDASGTGTTIVAEVNTIGGRVKGNYSGFVTLEINGGVGMQIGISGSFDVLRTQ